MEVVRRVDFSLKEDAEVIVLARYVHCFKWRGTYVFTAYLKKSVTRTADPLSVIAWRVFCFVDAIPRLGGQSRARRANT